MNLNCLPRARRAPALAALSTVICGAALVLGGCATSTPPPTAQLAVASAALAHAVGAGSGELAPVETALARDKIARANVAITAKDNDAALVLAQQAQLDAQLAEAKAESAKARKSADAMQEAGRALREEMSRKTP
jgi:alkylhydroperoxidase family enzyme